MNIETINSYYSCPLKGHYDTINQPSIKTFYDYYLRISHQVVGLYFLNYKTSEKQLAINRLYHRFDKLIQELKAPAEVISAFKICSKTLIKGLDAHVNSNCDSIIGPTLFRKEYTIGETIDFTVDGISKKIEPSSGSIYYDFYLSYPFLSTYKGNLSQFPILNAIKDIVVNQSIFDKEDLNRSRFVIIDAFAPRLTAIYFHKLKYDLRFNFIEQLLAGLALQINYPRPDPQACSNCRYKDKCKFAYK